VTAPSPDTAAVLGPLRPYLSAALRAAPAGAQHALLVVATGRDPGPILEELTSHAGGGVLLRAEGGHQLAAVPLEHVRSVVETFTLGQAGEELAGPLEVGQSWVALFGAAGGVSLSVITWSARGTLGRAAVTRAAN